MNLTTIGSIPSRNWKSIKGQYVAAAAGVALAVGAVVTFGPSTGTSKPVATQPQGISAVTRPVQAPHQYFYIVASEAERSALFGEGVAQVVVANSPAANGLLAYGAAEMLAAGTEFTIIDTTEDRTRGLASFGMQASQADVMPSVLSTERATWPQVDASPALSLE